MKKELHNGRALVGQHLFKATNVFIATFPDTFGNQIVHAYNENILVVAAIEDNNAPIARRVFVDSPQVIVR